MYINSDNYYKYIKYKYKYIKLKNIKNQVGGAIETSSIINDKSTILAFLSPLVIPFTMNKMTYDVNGYIIHISIFEFNSNFIFTSLLLLYQQPQQLQR